MIETGDESLQTREGHEALTAYVGEVWRWATTPPPTEPTDDEAQSLFRSLFPPTMIGTRGGAANARDDARTLKGRRRAALPKKISEKAHLGDSAGVAFRSRSCEITGHGAS
jgi:hypothetical protein